MKKIITLTTFTLFVVTAICQTLTDSEFNKDYYLQKSKKQKKMGWGMLKAAVAAGTVPLLFKPDHPADNPYYIYNDKSKTGAILVLTGISLGSIPFFISSSKNKKRAAEIAVDNESLNVPGQKGFTLNSFPTFTLRVGL